MSELVHQPFSHLDDMFYGFSSKSPLTVRETPSGLTVAVLREVTRRVPVSEPLTFPGGYRESDFHYLTVLSWQRNSPTPTWVFENHDIVVGRRDRVRRMVGDYVEPQAPLGGNCADSGCTRLSIDSDRDDPRVRLDYAGVSVTDITNEPIGSQFSEKDIEALRALIDAAPDQDVFNPRGLRAAEHAAVILRTHDLLGVPAREAFSFPAALPSNA